MNLNALNSVTKNNTRTTSISDFMELELKLIYPNPNQPRKNFEEIESLSQSIKTNGLIQPIAVKKIEQGYMIISGERRYQAHKLAHMTTIKAHILNPTDKQVQEMALIENIQREDLTDFEKAKFIGELWASGNYSQKSDLAKALSKSSSYISKCFGCLKLDKEIQADLQEGNSSLGLSVLEELSKVKDKQAQKEIYKKLLNKEITREGIKEFDNNSFPPVKKFKKVMTLDEKDSERVCDYLSELSILKHYKITIEEI